MRRLHPVIIFLIIIFSLISIPNPSYTAENVYQTQSFSANYSISSVDYYKVIDTLEFEISQSVSKITITIVKYKSWAPNQLVELKGITTSVSYSKEVITDDVDNNYYELNFGSVSQSFNVEITYLVATFSADISIDPNNVGGYDTNSKIFKEYTKPSSRIESDNSQIISTANSIVGNEKNPYNKAKLIYDWVASELEYELQGEEHGAVYGLQNKKGDCTEFATLFIALCRAVGVPARLIIGSVPNGSLEFHTWAEFYLQNYGWIYADPTWGNTEPDQYFGKLGDNKHLLRAKGSDLEPLGTYDILFSGYYYGAPGSVSISMNLAKATASKSDFSSPEIVNILDASEKVEYASMTINEAKNHGFTTTATESDLETARYWLVDAFDKMSQDNIQGATSSANNAKTYADKAAKDQASIAIAEAEQAIENAKGTWRSIFLGDAEDDLAKAKQEYNNGNYFGAVTEAGNAKDKAEQGVSLPCSSFFFGFIILAVCVIRKHN